MDLKWIEMPVAANDEGSHQDRPKYPIETSALLLYRGEMVYVPTRDKAIQGKALRHPDVRLLSKDEVRDMEATLKFPISLIDDAAFAAQKDLLSRHTQVRLGDLVAWSTHKFRLNECHACRMRRTWLNRVVIWGWWRPRS